MTKLGKMWQKLWEISQNCQNISKLWEIWQKLWKMWQTCGKYGKIVGNMAKNVENVT